MRTFSRYTIIGTTVDRPAQMHAASGKQLDCSTIMVDVHHGGSNTSRFTVEAWGETRPLLKNIGANQRVLLSGQIKINSFQTTRGGSFSRTVLYLDDITPLSPPQPISPDLLTPANHGNPALRSNTPTETQEDYPF